MGAPEGGGQHHFKWNVPVNLKKGKSLTFSFVIEARIDASALHDVVFIVICFSVPDDVQCFAHGS